MRAGRRKSLTVSGGATLAVSLAVAFATAAGNAVAEAPPGAGRDGAIAASKSAVGELAETLKGYLGSALKEQGPDGALAVCQTIAPEAATAIGDKYKVVLRRTALKVRNPANAPDPFEARVLAEFEQQARSGTDLETLTRSEIVETDGGPKLRFMKAIPMADQPCSTCHGTNIKPTLADDIRRLYPHDQAIGFKPGELRGAFSVVAPVR